MNKWFKRYWYKDYKFLATCFVVMVLCTIIKIVVKLLEHLA